MTGTHEPLDLDTLLAEVEAEALQRRGTVGWPAEAENRIAQHLARTAPIADVRPSLDRLVTAIEEASFIRIDVPTASTRPPVTLMKAALRKLLAFWFRFVVDQVTALGIVTARTLRAVVGRLEEVERRLDQVEALSLEAAELPAAAQASQALDTWRHQLVLLATTAGGRTLFGDQQAAEMVAELQAAGVDAYGLERSGDPFGTALELRQGDLLAHLSAVEEGGLGCALLAGCTEGLDSASFSALVGALVLALRPGGTLAVTAEAPWSWRARVGPAESDLAVGRPLSADTWLDRLHEVGFAATAVHAEDGRSYLVTAQRQ